MHLGTEVFILWREGKEGGGFLCSADDWPAAWKMVGSGPDNGQSRMKDEEREFPTFSSSFLDRGFPLQLCRLPFTHLQSRASSRKNNKFGHFLVVVQLIQQTDAALAYISCTTMARLFIFPLLGHEAGSPRTRPLWRTWYWDLCAFLPFSILRCITCCKSVVSVGGSKTLVSFSDVLRFYF